MAPFIIRRLLWTVLVMFVITVLVFLIFFETPGVDPARQIAGRNPSPQALAEIRHQFGLDRPVPVRYVIMMKKLFVTRDLVSYSNQGQSVVPEIVAAAPAPIAFSMVSWPFSRATRILSETLGSIRVTASSSCARRMASLVALLL